MPTGRGPKRGRQSAQEYVDYAEIGIVQSPEVDLWVLNGPPGGAGIGLRDVLGIENGQCGHENGRSGKGSRGEQFAGAVWNDTPPSTPRTGSTLASRWRPVPPECILPPAQQRPCPQHLAEPTRRKVRPGRADRIRALRHRAGHHAGNSTRGELCATAIRHAPHLGLVRRAAAEGHLSRTQRIPNLRRRLHMHQHIRHPR
jgi:hypothetical protein